MNVITAIPTLYRGRRYRSRLEARWAAFFDLLGWRYEYEPTDFSGLIPDFVLFGAQTVFVEVKPVVAFPEDVAREIERSGCHNDVLIVGMTVPIPQSGSWPPNPCLGWLGEAEEFWEETGMIEHIWGQALLGVWGRQRKGERKDDNLEEIIGFCHRDQDFSDRITGIHDGGCYGGVGLDPDRIGSLWAEAGNEVQWRSLRAAR